MISEETGRREAMRADVMRLARDRLPESWRVTSLVGWQVVSATLPGRERFLVALGGEHPPPRGTHCRGLGDAPPHPFAVAALGYCRAGPEGSLVASRWPDPLPSPPAPLEVVVTESAEEVVALLESWTLPHHGEGYEAAGDARRRREAERETQFLAERRKAQEAEERRRAEQERRAAESRGLLPVSVDEGAERRPVPAWAVVR